MAKRTSATWKGLLSACFCSEHRKFRPLRRCRIMCDHVCQENGVRRSQAGAYLSAVAVRLGPSTPPSRLATCGSVHNDQAARMPQPWHHRAMSTLDEFEEAVAQLHLYLLSRDFSLSNQLEVADRFKPVDCEEALSEAH